jgi:putative membrane protein
MDCADEREPDPRFTFANERTFLAWNRTALALVAGALAVAQLLNGVSHAARLAIGVPLATLAAAIALTSHHRWQANQRALRHGAPLPSSGLPLLLAIGVATISLITVAVLLVELVA